MYCVFHSLSNDTCHRSAILTPFTSIIASTVYIGLEESWKQRIVAERGDHYLVPELAEVPTSEKVVRPISISLTRYTFWILIIIAVATGFPAISRKLTGEYKKTGLLSSEEFSSENSNGLITDSTHSACYGATDANQMLQMAPSE